MSIKLQEEYGDAVNVLLVETGKLSDVETEQFVIKKKWKGGKSIWTRERPFDIGLNYLPAAVLLSPDGKVVLKGNPIELHPRIKSEIDAELAAARKPPKDVPDVVGKAIVDF